MLLLFDQCPLLTSHIFESRSKHVLDVGHFEEGIALGSHELRLGAIRLNRPYVLRELREGGGVTSPEWARPTSGCHPRNSLRQQMELYAVGFFGWTLSELDHGFSDGRTLFLGPEVSKRPESWAPD